MVGLLAWRMAGRAAPPDTLAAQCPRIRPAQVLAANVSDEAHPLLQRSDRCCNAERMDEARCCRPHAMLWQVP